MDTDELGFHVGAPGGFIEDDEVILVLYSPAKAWIRRRFRLGFRA
jgi:hypothetical protein